MGRTDLRRVCACVCALLMLALLLPAGKIAPESGMNGHLAKPYDVAESMRTLHEILCSDDR